MSSPLAHLVPTCFVEADPQLELTRRATIECIGTLLLTTVAAGAGLAVTQVEPGNHGFALLLSALVTSGALVGLILALGKVSGGHFNPLITCCSGFRAGAQWQVHSCLRCGSVDWSRTWRSDRKHAVSNAVC